MNDPNTAGLAEHRAELNEYYGSKWGDRRQVRWGEICPDWARPYGRMYETRNREVEARVPASIGRLLDCGCGVGDLLLELHEHAEEIAGVDLADVNVARARENLAAGGIEGRIELAPAEELPFGDGSFDCVLLLDVVEHITERQAAFAELARVLAPGGRLIVVTPVVPTQRLLERTEWLLRVPADLLRALLGRRRARASEAFEQFLDRSELDQLVAGAGLRVEERAKICFYPGPEGGGTLLTLIRVVSKLPGGMFAVNGLCRLFELIERARVLNQKWLYVAVKPG